MPCKWGDSPFPPAKQSGEGLAEGHMVSLLGGGALGTAAMLSHAVVWASPRWSACIVPAGLGWCR